ncbi:hypothetical protein [Phocaeicola plebeius]|uniref:hypothetical protein n=1 Tax=Phocaeicola plebeius TaxID=310297 RepID=UPI00195BA4A8|nr:hypothetical protein [Phocaeicola plebeius]MBM6842910.1 hypothetical protein [Phocaeicola plebeius]
MKIVQVLLTLVLTSFFFFPFYPTFLPTVNTKMMLAAMGGILLLMKLARNRSAQIDKGIFSVSLWAALVSLASLISMVLNNTPDDSYLGYVVSMWVWLAAAYFVVNVIKFTHGTVTVENVCAYLISVGVLQCFLAIAIDTIPAVKMVVDSILDGEGFMGKNENRLYGLGCALDVAGTRFSTLLVMIAFLLPKAAQKEKGEFYITLLLAAFCVITSIGSVIGRTTIVGVGLSLVYLFYTCYLKRDISEYARIKLTGWVVGGMCVSIIVAVGLYNFSPQWQNYFRFGFEGFFSLVENGHWEVRSNNQLAAQFIFPDNAWTWLIGDGHMAPTTIDPYYVGKVWTGFYKGTDVGYSRFLFYFGLTGLITFSFFFVKVCQVCASKIKPYRDMFIIFLLINFIVWLKVSTDIFLVFAPFLCLAASANEDNKELIES